LPNCALSDQGCTSSSAREAADLRRCASTPPATRPAEAGNFPVSAQRAGRAFGRATLIWLYQCHGVWWLAASAGVPLPITSSRVAIMGLVEQVSIQSLILSPPGLPNRYCSGVSRTRKGEGMHCFTRVLRRLVLLSASSALAAGVGVAALPAAPANAGIGFSALGSTLAVAPVGHLLAQPTSWGRGTTTGELTHIPLTHSTSAVVARRSTGLLATMHKVALPGCWRRRSTSSTATIEAVARPSAPILARNGRRACAPPDAMKKRRDGSARTR
jgi:hypothetical protein